MTNAPATPETPRFTAPKTELGGLLRRTSAWFWKRVDDAKDMDTKPFDGIL